MSVECDAANDCCKKSSREGLAGGVVGSLHEEARDSSRTTVTRLTVEEKGEKELTQDYVMHRA